MGGGTALARSPRKRPIDVAKAIPDAHYAVIEEASHFSIFAECKPDAAASEGEDPICSDGAGVPLQEVHAQLIDMVEATFPRRSEAVAEKTGCRHETAVCHAHRTKSY